MTTDVGGAYADVKLTLRLPADVHRALVAAAAREHRSLNAHLVHVLEASTMPADDEPDDART